MKFLDDLISKPLNILKFAGLAIAAIVVIAVAFRLIVPSFKSLSGVATKNLAFQSIPSFDSGMGMGGASYEAEMMDDVSLSVRNVAGSYIPPIPGTTTGNDAEDYEVTQYGATIETRDLENSCGQITNLKARDDVIFENANEYEHSCNYVFKVERSSATEILSIINSMDPKELDESTYTIKRVIEDYTSQEEILKNKLSSVEATLNDAINSYDEIAEVATNAQDAETLARIIDSKIRLIERLANERININTQLDRLSRSKAEQLDRLNYVYFNVYVLENKFVDGENLKDSWKMAVKNFVRDINQIVQDITINLLSLMFGILQYIIYFFIILFVVKYGWKLTKDIWQK